jgi:hypothetical protein
MLVVDRSRYFAEELWQTVVPAEVEVIGVVQTTAEALVHQSQVKVSVGLSRAKLSRILKFRTKNEAVLPEFRLVDHCWKTSRPNLQRSKRVFVFQAC